MSGVGTTRARPQRWRAGSRRLLVVSSLLCAALLALASCGSRQHAATVTQPSATADSAVAPTAPAAAASATGVSTTVPATATAPFTPSPTAAPSATPEPTATPPPTATAVPTEAPAETPTDVPAPTGDGLVVVIDVGHDASTGGALGVEYVDTLRTALATRDALAAAGYVVYLTRADESTILYGDPSLMPPNADSMDLSYNEGYVHATQALRYSPDLVLSIHYNGADDPDVSGATVYYCDNGGPQNAALAGLIRDELVGAFAELGYNPPYVAATEDSAIGKTYGELATLGNVYNAPFDYAGNRLGGIPAVLTEALFETNPTERALIEDDTTLNALAQAYVRAIDAYFGR